MDAKKHLVELAQGVLVENDVLHIAEKVQEYDPNLFLQYCDPETSGLHDAPYRLMEHCIDGQDRIVFYIWELDNSVLERIRAADTQARNVLLDIHGKNLLAKKQQLQRYQDKKEAQADIIRHVLKSRQSEYTIPTEDGGVAKVSDTRPVERVKGP